MTEQIAEAENEFRAAEVERLEAIEGVCDKYADKVEPDKLASLKAEAVEGQRDVKDLTLSLLRASRPGAGVNISVGGPVVDDREKLTASMLVKGAPDVAGRKYKDRPEVLDFARQNRLHAAELCAAALRSDHRTVPRNRSQMIRAAFSTDALGSTLRDVGNDILLDAYRRTPSIWRSFAQKRSAPDFRERNAIRPSSIGGVEKVGPGGELKHVKLDGDEYLFSVDTWGGLMVWTRQQAINDDIGAYAQAAEELGKRCARKINDLVAQVLLNVAIELNTTTLDSDGLSSAVQALRNRTDASGDAVDIQPHALIVPPALEEQARTLLESTEIAAPEGTGTGNVWQGIAQLGVEPRLSNSNFDGNSAGRWILTGQPSDAPIICAFLGGNEDPVVEQLGLQHDANTLGYATRVYGDFGAAEGDTASLVPADQSE